MRLRGRAPVVAFVSLSCCLLAGTAWGLSCIDINAEVLELELETVTVDGKPVTDTSAWQRAKVSVESTRSGDQTGVRFSLRGDNRYWKGSMDYAPAP